MRAAGKLSASTAKTPPMANCPISLPRGVSPSERSFDIFAQSSRKPRSPRAVITPTSRTPDMVTGSQKMRWAAK